MNSCISHRRLIWYMKTYSKKCVISVKEFRKKRKEERCYFTSNKSFRPGAWKPRS